MKKYLPVLILAIFLLPCATHSQYWQKVRNIPSPYATNYWLDIYFLPSDNNYVWLCGFNGMTLRSTDGGASWQGSTIPGTDHFESICFPTTQTGYVSGPTGMYKSTDGGATWSDVKPAGAVETWGNFFIDANNGVLVGGGCASDQNFWRTTDGGATWAGFVASQPNTGLTHAVLYSANGLGFAVSSGKIWVTHDGGFTWSIYATSGTNLWQEHLSVNQPSFLVPVAGTTCTGGGLSGGMRFSTDDGFTWNETTIFQPLFGSALTGARSGWVCGYDRSIYYTSDAGVTWELRNCGIEQGNNLDDILFLNSNTGWVVGQGVYKYSPPIQTISKTAIDFLEVCIPGQRTDSVWVKNYSQSSVDATWQLSGANAGEFAIITPAQNFSVLNCDSTLILITFKPATIGPKVANLRVNIVGGPTFDVALAGNAKNSTAQISDTLLVFNPLKCGKTEEKSLRWTAQTTDEWIKSILFVQGSTDINSMTTTPFRINPAGIDTKFNAITRDTGWIKARFKVTLTPCYLDTFITVMAYGVSPIINVKPTLDVEGNCVSQQLDSIPVLNTGNDTMEISSAQIIDMTKGFSVVGWTSGNTLPVRIAPGESDTIIILFAPPVFNSYVTKLRLINNDVTTARGVRSPLDIDLKGTILSTKTTCKDTLIDFGDICIYDTTTRKISIKNPGNIQSYLNSPVLKRTIFNFIPSTGSYPVVVKAADSMDFTAYFYPQGIGLFTDTVLFITSPCFDTVKIVLTGRGINSGLSTNPTSINGLVQTTVPYTKVLTVYNTGVSDLKITNISLNPPRPDWTLQITPPLPVDLMKGDSIVFRLDFTTMIDTTLIGDICIDADGKCPLQHCIPVNLSSYSKSIKVQPDNIDFKLTTCEKKILTDTVTIVNEGLLRDTLTGIYFVPQLTAFRITNMPNLPVYLNTDEKIILLVEYNSPDEGLHQTILTIESANLRERKLQVAVQGEFRKTETAISDTLIDFGTFEVCDTSRCGSVWIYNSGTMNDTLDITIVKKQIGFDINPPQTLVCNANDSAEVTVCMLPSAFPGVGTYSEKYILRSKVCPKTITIDVSVNIIKPVLTINPQAINFGNVWIGDSLEKEVTITNNTQYPRKITAVYLKNNFPEFSFLTKAPLVLLGGESEVVKIKFKALKTGIFADTMVVCEESVCRDTTSIFLTANVPEEIYYPKVILGNYSATPGENITIIASLEQALPRVKATEVTYTISFDKWLFMPESISLFDGTTEKLIALNYTNGVLSGKIGEGDALNLFHRAGDFMLIKGRTLFSSPEYTPLVWTEFSPVTDKKVTLETQDGSLRVSPVCHPIAELRYKLLPQLSASIGNQVNTSGSLALNLSTTESFSINLNISNSLGSSVFARSYTLSGNSERIDIDVSGLSDGVYFISFVSQYGHIWSEKFSVIK